MTRKSGRRNSPDTRISGIVGERVLARRGFPIGQQQLSADASGQHYVAIRNRSYYSKHPIPLESVGRWRKALVTR